MKVLSRISNFLGNVGKQFFGFEYKTSFETLEDAIKACMGDQWYQLSLLAII